MFRYDYKVEQCPLFDLDILYSGSRLTCRQLRYCSV